MGKSDSALLPMGMSYDDFKNGEPLESDVYILEPNKKSWKKQWLRLPAKKGQMGYGRLQVFKSSKGKHIAAIHDLSKCHTQNVSIIDLDTNQFSLLVPGYKVEKLGKKTDYQVTQTVCVICPNRAALACWVQALWQIISEFNPPADGCTPPVVQGLAAEEKQSGRAFVPNENMRMHRSTLQRTFTLTRSSKKARPSTKLSAEVLPTQGARNSTTATPVPTPRPEPMAFQPARHADGENETEKIKLASKENDSPVPMAVPSMATSTGVPEGTGPVPQKPKSRLSCEIDDLKVEDVRQSTSIESLTGAAPENILPEKPIRGSSRQAITPSTDLFELSRDKVSSSELSHAKVESSELSHAKVESSELSHDKVESSELSHDKVESYELSRDKVESYELPRDKVETPELSHDRVESSELSHDRVESSELSHDRVESSELSHDKVESSELSHDRVESSELSHDKVDSSELSLEKADSLELSLEKADSSELSLEKFNSSELSLESFDSPEPSRHEVNSSEPSNDKVDSSEPSRHEVNSSEPSNDKVDSSEHSRHNATSPEPSRHEVISPELSSDKVDSSERSSSRVASPEILPKKANVPLEAPAADRAFVPGRRRPVPIPPKSKQVPEIRISDGDQLAPKNPIILPPSQPIPPPFTPKVATPAEDVPEKSASSVTDATKTVNITQPFKVPAPYKGA